jgi:NADP-dependent 3-hydroxy acid dehydrogenase YdfG
MRKKVIIVTGASSGIGKATALRFLTKDNIVIAAARRTHMMEDLKSVGADIKFLDLTDEKSISELVSQVFSKYGRIDVLVNNAGYGLYDAVGDVSIEMAKKQFDVNLFSLAKITQLVLPVMQRQHGGTIINLSSIGGKVCTPLGAWYHATKHAIEGFSNCLRIETQQFGIKVVIIEPGLIQAEWSSIAGNNMMEISGNGDYRQLANDFNRQLNLLYKKNKASHPDVIAKVIMKAVESNNPKTRYAAGKMAKLILMLRKILSDKYFDYMLYLQMKFSIV